MHLHLKLKIEYYQTVNIQRDIRSFKSRSSSPCFPFLHLFSRYTLHPNLFISVTFPLSPYKHPPSPHQRNSPSSRQFCLFYSSFDECNSSSVFNVPLRAAARCHCQLQQLHAQENLRFHTDTPTHTVHRISSAPVFTLTHKAFVYTIPSLCSFGFVQHSF